MSLDEIIDRCRARTAPPSAGEARTSLGLTDGHIVRVAIDRQGNMEALGDSVPNIVPSLDRVENQGRGWMLPSQHPTGCNKTVQDCTRHHGDQRFHHFAGSCRDGGLVTAVPCGNVFGDSNCGIKTP